MIDERELIRRARKLIRRYDNMKIVGSRGEWSGNARQGFNFNPLDGSGGGGGGGGIVIQTGACCLDGDCYETTQFACVSAGGTYQGNGTICSSVTVNCTETTSGACCVDDNCSIETPQHCFDIGGIYQGDDTVCDPNPCPTSEFCPDCSAYFSAFDGSGRKFLMYQRSIEGTSDREESTNCTPPDVVSVTASGSAIFGQHYNEFCILVTDIDVSTSEHTVIVNGTVTDSCAGEPNLDCFCNVTPEFNQCTSFIDGFTDCNICSSCTGGSDTTITTADSRVRTVIFAIDCDCDCTVCPDCSAHCTVTGSYIVTETLSHECP